MYMSSGASYTVRRLIVLVLFVLACGSSAFAAVEYVPGEILVKFKDTSPSRSGSISSIHSYVGSTRKKDFGKLKIHYMKLPEGLSVEEAIRLYKQDPNVAYAEPNYIVRAAVTPNDPRFSNLWGLDNGSDTDIDAPEAWDITTGSTDVVIAVIDSGVARNHPDLSANMWTNSGEDAGCNDGLDNDGNGYIDDCRGWDFLSNDNDPSDYNGHGTHVAGTIAAEGDNATGVTGVMWQAKIMPLRILGIEGTGNTTDALEAILYANANGAHIINNSWGGGGYSQALKDAIDDSSAVVVCAAGNGGEDGIGDNSDSIPFYPASYSSSNIISVAATNNADTLAAFSNFGATSVDLGAPGVSIDSTIPQISTGLPATVYPTESFNSASGSLPLLNWRRGGTNSSWAVTVGTGVTGNSLEDSPGGANYANNTGSWAGYTVPINSSVKNNIYTLSFKWKGVLENNKDFLDILYSTNGVTWYYVDYRTGSNPDFPNFTSDSTTDFTIIAEELNSFYFGFGLTSDSTVVFDGVYLDDVTLKRSQLSISSYSYTMAYSGTSMATPHVSGVAGLIKSHDPSCTSADIKNLILNSVDTVSSLSGKVLTGGRLNAYKALSTLQCPAPVFTGGTDNSGGTVTTSDGGGGGGGGGCFIATAAFGSPLHPYVKELRSFRDRHLLTNRTGKALVSLYYKYSPPLAEVIRKNDQLRRAVRIMLVPVVMVVIHPNGALVVLTAFFLGSLWIFRKKGS